MADLTSMLIGAAIVPGLFGIGGCSETPRSLAYHAAPFLPWFLASAIDLEVGPALGSSGGRIALAALVIASTAGFNVLVLGTCFDLGRAQ